MGSSNLIRRISAFRRSSLLCTSKSVPQSRLCTTSTVSAPRIKVLPWLMLPPSAGGSYNFYCLAEDRVISINKTETGEGGGVASESQVVGSSHGWIAYYNKRGDGELFLSDPLSGRHIKLPRIDTLPGAIPVYSPGHARLKKLIISHPPDHEECIAMAIYGYGDFLAFCRPGRSTGWTRIGDLAFVYKDGGIKEGELLGRQYEEMVYSASLNLFFCTTMESDFEAWDLSKSPKLVWRANSDDLKWSDESDSDDEDNDIDIKGSVADRYLVYGEEANKLYVVTRNVRDAEGSCVKKDFNGSYPQKTLDSDVHMMNWELRRSINVNRVYPQKTIEIHVRRLDWEKGRWIYVNKRLDGQSMFIGTNQSMAVAAAPELKPHSIYFTHEIDSIPDDDDPEYKYGGHDIGVFDYRRKTISPCYYPCDVQSMKRIIPAPLWFTPSTPPP